MGYTTEATVMQHDKFPSVNWSIPLAPNTTMCS